MSTKASLARARARKPSRKAAAKAASKTASKSTARPKAKTAKAGTAKRPAVKTRAAARKSAPAVAATPAAGTAATAAARRAERRRQFPEALRLRTFMASLTVDDIHRSIAFYVDGLGFTVKERWEQNGNLQGVMLVAGRCEIGLSQDDWGKGRDRVKGVGVSFYAETGQSLDLLAALAREHGIEPDGPKTAPWGDRVLEFHDPDGFKLTIFWPKAS